MNSRRTVIIAVAVVLAAIAFVGNVYYLNNVRQDAYGKAQLVEVFKVTKAIPKGQTGEVSIQQEFVKSGDIPTEYRPGSAIKDLNDIKGKVAITNLSPGQVLVTGQFVDPDQAQVTFAEQVPNDQVAVSVSVDKVHGVAGLLLPGDKVNMLVASKDGDSTSVQTLYQNVEIRAIGAKTAPQAGDTAANGAAATTGSDQAATADAGLITFNVPLDAAQRIALVQSASDKYTLYLTLVRSDNKEVPKPGNIDTKGVFNNTGGTPYPANS